MMPRLTTALADRYRIERELGAGGMATVYAHDLKHDRRVALKVLKPELAAVSDFGIALAVSAAAGGRMTETDLSLGTPHYMSPEQATGEKEITGRSDVYSLGSVLYEMLAGDPPHTGASAQQIIMKIVSEEAAPVTTLRKTVPPNVAAAVALALEKLPADRFERAAKFAAALTNPAFATTAQRLDRGGPGGADHRRTRGPWAWLPWVLAATLAVTAAWLARGRPHTPNTETVRFAADLDSVQALPSMASVIAMPDGRTILVGAVIGDQQVLVSRRLDRMETSRIRGSEGADRAFTSPDGRWVAFAARGKLVKLPRIARVPGFDALQQDRRVGELIQPMGLPTNASTPR